MSSAYSTITSNVNLLLVDTKVITKNNPYIAYVSSVNIPGRIATIRDATGFLSTPNSIVVSTLKNVLFADGTSSFSITQPFGYITLSARDPNTWNIINTFAFPQPQGVTNVSSIYVNDGIIANSLLVNTYISTNYLNAPSISTNQIKTSTIFTSTLYANIVSTNILNAVTISTNQIKTSTIFTSTLTLNTANNNGILSLSNDGKTLLINNIPSGNFTAVSTATTNFNMNGFSISNVNTLNTSNISSVNISTATITTSSLRGVNILSSNLTISNVLTGNYMSGTQVDANTLNSRVSFNLFDAPNNTFLNPIIGYNNQVVIQNQLLVSNYFTYTAGIINSNYLNNCNNDINNVNSITVSNIFLNDSFYITPTLLNRIIGSNNNIVFGNSINMSNNSIINLTQTPNINDVATNVVVPFYVLASNIAGNSLSGYVWNPLFFSTHPTFTVNSNIHVYGKGFKVNFSFSAIITNFNNILPPFAFYYTLSNTVTNTEYNGLLINSNTPILVSNFYYIIPFTGNYNNSYSFSYEDIFEFDDNSDLISVNLYAYATNLLPIGSVFTNDTHNITFQPIQPA